MEVKLNGRARQREKLARAIVKELRTAMPHAKERCLSDWEVERLFKRHWAACKRAFRNPKVFRVRSRQYGGFVSNSYKHEAHTDFVEVETFARRLSVLEAMVNSRDFELTTFIYAQRKSGASRPYGRGTEEIHKVLLEGQVEGRIVCSDGVWKEDWWKKIGKRG